MRLDFNILWVDDQPDRIDAQIKAITRAMTGEGFNLKPTLCTNLDEVTDQLSDNVFKDEVDLIMVDWDLGQELKGQTVITRIREDIPYKDIIFYSAVHNVSNLKEASYKEEHEGIYFVTREDLVDEVIHLFNSMIKKILDLDHTRGIVMGATSDVDQTARECLQLAHDMLTDEAKAQMLDEMVGLLDRKIPDLSKRVEKLKKSPDVQNIISSHFTFTASDRLRILLGVLSSGHVGDQKAHVANIKSYMENIVPKRNVLGHQVLSPEGRPQTVACTDGKEITLDEMRKLRKELLDARERFRNLHGTLSDTAPPDS